MFVLVAHQTVVTASTKYTELCSFHLSIKMRLLRQTNINGNELIFTQVLSDNGSELIFTQVFSDNDSELIFTQVFSYNGSEQKQRADSQEGYSCRSECYDSAGN